MKKIILNRIKTPDGTILTSYHVHDFVKYEDENGETYMTDGGNDYLKRSLNKIPAEDLSVYDDAPFDIIRISYHCGDTDKYGQLTWIPISEMSNEYLKNCIEYNEVKGRIDCQANKYYVQELEYRKKNCIFVED